MGLSSSSNFKLWSRFAPGPKNLITDLAGITVGHVTLEAPDKGIHTGVTALLPSPDNLFRNKLPCGCAVINGFGKTTGLVQVRELGQLESPILFTNTLSVGTALTALVRYMLRESPEIGTTSSTVNGIVTECNDGSLNDIRGLHVTEAMVQEALTRTETDFAEGPVGAGCGMVCMGLKGGIGSASRRVPIKAWPGMVGSLVLTNFGRRENLRINSIPVNPSPQEASPICTEGDRGSCIIVLATDLPLSSRQLSRLARRSMISLGRLGSYSGNGSGDIAIAFSTAQTIPNDPEQSLLSLRFLTDAALDPVFEAGCECVEEALLSSLTHGKTTTGFQGKTVLSLDDYLAELGRNLHEFSL